MAMSKLHPKRTFLMFAMGLILAIALSRGYSFDKRLQIQNGKDSLTRFNDHLIAQIHRAQMPTEDSGKFRQVNRYKPSAPEPRDTETLQAELESSSPSTEKFENSQSSQTDQVGIRPLIGKKSSTKLPPKYKWLDPRFSIEAIQHMILESQVNRPIFGWIQLRSDVKPSELGEMVKSLKIEVLGDQAKFVRLKFPLDLEAIARLADLPVIEGFGLMPPEAKSHSGLSDYWNDAPIGTELPVFITTMDADQGGTTTSELKALGATLGSYDEDTRTYLANVDQLTLDKLLSSDLVENVAPNSIVRLFLSHLTSVLGVDSTRDFSDTDESFTGFTGKGVDIGVLDTGINANHLDFAEKSICAKSYVYYESDLDAVIDTGLHGTHVSAIAAGGGRLNPAWAGVAPGIRSLRLGKVVDSDGRGDVYSFFNGVNFMSSNDPCPDEPDSVAPPRIVNVSLGGYTSLNDGTSLLSRKVDAAVFNNRQNYVISAGNDGEDGVGDTSSTKNAISVGAISDSGIITSFSSHGPTGDGRLSPHVVAPGYEVAAALGNGVQEGYEVFSGTSMSSPAVAGLATVLLDSRPEFEGHPAAVKAALMAAAVKPKRWVGGPANIPQDNTNGPGHIQAEYGLGVASLIPFELDDVDQGFSMGDLTSDEVASTKITVPEGVARLDIVLTWLEPTAGGFGQTVLSNLDLYLDRDSDCEESACGEFSSRSSVDNVEWLLIKDPEPGTYEVKAVPANAFDNAVQFGIAWVLIEDDVPELSISTDSNTIQANSEGITEITLNVYSSSYVAAGSTLHIMCRQGSGEDESTCPERAFSRSNWLPGSTVNRYDGTSMQLDIQEIGEPVHLGSITNSSVRTVKLRFPSEFTQRVGTHSLYFVATSWNGKSSYEIIDVVVDDESEGLPEHEIEPSNNSIEETMYLTDEMGTLDLDFILATREPGEPIHRLSDIPSQKKLFSHNNIRADALQDTMNARYNSVWFAIEAPEDVTQLTFNGISDGVLINIYRDSPDLASLIAHSTRTGSWGNAEEDPILIVNLEPAKNYFIQVYSCDDLGQVEIPWVLGVPQPPPNDLFAAAQQVEGDTGRVHGTNFNADLEPFEYYGGNTHHSTWFWWSPSETAAYEFDVEGDAIVVVLNGDNPIELRRISTVPQKRRDPVYAYVDEGETYYLVVLSNTWDDNLAGYWLEWSKAVEVPDHEENDLFMNASSLTSDTTAVNDSPSLGRTTETAEPLLNGVGSRWWTWTPTDKGDYTFTMTPKDIWHASVFEGTALENLREVGQGREFVTTLEEGTKYYISISARSEHMYFGMSYRSEAEIELSWGLSPTNDRMANPMQLSGSSGNVSYSHQFATTSREDRLLHGMTNTLWWKWTANETGWYLFENSRGMDLPFDQRRVDSSIVVYDENDNKRIANSDRTYFLTGKPEATFHATEDESYLIQSVLRKETSTDQYAQVTMSWRSIDTPPFMRLRGRLREADADPALEVQLLRSAHAMVSDEVGDQLFVATDDRILVFEVPDQFSLPNLVNEVALIDGAEESGRAIRDPLLLWEHNESSLYVISRNAIWVANNILSDDASLEKCVDISEPYLGTLAHISSTTKGDYFYILGSPYVDRLVVYQRTARCEFSRAQSLDQDDMPNLDNANSFTFDSKDEYMYMPSDGHLLAFSRNSDTGELQFQTAVDFGTSVVEPHAWEDSSVAGIVSDSHLFVVGFSNPSVVLFDLSSPDNPIPDGSVTEYYLSRSYGNSAFPTLEPLPIVDRYGGCRTISTHRSSPAVDFGCEGTLLTIKLNKEGVLEIADFLLAGKRDRFNQELRNIDFGETRGLRIGARPMSQELYLLNTGDTNTLAVFDHASSITDDPYTR